MFKILRRSDPMLFRMFFGYTLTFAVVELGAKICHSIDGLMISNLLGDAAIAAHGLTGPYTTVLGIISAIIVTGSQAMLTRAAGKGDNEGLNAAFSVALEVAAVLSAAITVVLYLFNGEICTLLGASGQDAAFRGLVIDYNRGFFAVVPFLILHPVLCSMATLDGKKKYVAISTAVLSAADIGLNLFFVRELHLGMFGVGFSSTISQLLAVLVLLPVFFRADSLFRFRPMRPPLRSVLELMGTGLPKLTRKSCTTIKKLMMNRLVLYAGGVSMLSAISVRNVVDDLAMSLGVGISGALLLMTQVFFSEEDEDAVKSTVAAAMLLLIFGVGGLAVLLFGTAPLFIPLFGLDAVNSAAAVTAIRYFAVSLVFICFNEMVFDYLQAVRKQKWAHIYIAFERLTILPIAYLLIRSCGIRGLYRSYIVGEVPITLGYLTISALLNRKHSAGILNAMLCIPNRFSEPCSMELTLTQPNQSAGISQTIERFCIEHGVDHRRAMHAALCAEEMTAIIVTQGFSRSGGTHHCAVRITVSDGSPVLRFRDDCKDFRLKERYEATRSDDPCANIGIRLAYGLAKDVQLSHVLNLNTLMLSL